ncbi:glycoside hydrolase family 28 protein [Bythopirellula polymerisocia]|uniref:Polygalacturonase n=1 Tax=Bythopirellula polymerisocia TaxID=2528003 RepID=A0A5C6D3M6_9BACT|nr:glycoside hydrolase family 28 protein [Bythopirellula polymerisocia]TWU30474.1 Polygalacturonase [Bythopirellula polymerisocia]
MKHLIWLLFTTITSIAVYSNSTSAVVAELKHSDWDSVPSILAQIKSPEFPDRDFLVTDFGAIGDGNFDCHAAFQAAITECANSGGGRVVAPAGRWFVKGPIHLLSKVNLHLEKDATITFSTTPEDYLPMVLTRFEGTEVMNYSPLIYAFEQENIAITGEGVLDGQAGPNRWWNWKGHWGGADETGWHRGDPDQIKDVEKLVLLADAGVPPGERIFGKGHFLRSSFIQPYRSKNVLIEGVKFMNSPMWVINPVLSSNLTIRNVTVDSHGPNNDGCDPESCRNVLIENCLFNTGDDCIAIKSGRNVDGRRINVPSENIIIRGCTMKDGHGGVVLGSEMSGGIRNIFVEDCQMSSPQLERAIRLKSNSLRGGFLENLFVRNIEVGEVSEAVLSINLQYWDESGEFFPAVRNIFLENVTSQKCQYPLYLVGLPEQPIDHVYLKNCRFYNASEPSVIENVKHMFFLDVSQPR